MTEARAAPNRRRDAVLEAMEIFRDEMLPQSLSAWTLFLYICENEGLTVSELAHVSRLSVSLAARVVNVMAGEMDAVAGVADRVLVNLKSSPKDKRLKLVHLSPRGRRLCAQLDEIIAIAAPIRESAEEAEFLGDGDDTYSGEPGDLQAIRVRSEIVKLRAQITIDIDAEDFIAAADHQRRIAGLIGDLKEVYDQAELSFRERRARSLHAAIMAPTQVEHHTGHLHDYEDV